MSLISSISLSLISSCTVSGRPGRGFLLVTTALLAGLCSSCRGISPPAPSRQTTAPGATAPVVPVARASSPPLPPGEYGAALVEAGRVRFAVWKVTPDGVITTTPFDRDCYCCPPRPGAPGPTRHVVFEPDAAKRPARPPPRPVGGDPATAVLSWPALRGRLTAPGRQVETVWLQ